MQATKTVRSTRLPARTLLGILTVAAALTATAMATVGAASASTAPPWISRLAAGPARPLAGPAKPSAQQSWQAAAAACARRQPASVPGPPAGSRAAARAAARRLLARLELPAHARRLGQHPVPAGLAQPGEDFVALGCLADLHEFYRLRMTMQAAFRYLSTHLPRGMVLDATGREFQIGGATIMMFLSGDARHLPAGMEAVQLVDAIVPRRHGRSVLRVDAEVVWYPPRSRAEYLTPSRFREVRIASLSGNSRVAIIRSRRLIRSLAVLADRLHAAAPVQHSCPLNYAAYQLVFEPAVRGQSVVTVDANNCQCVMPTVGRAQQPPLFDPTSSLEALAARLWRTA
jgi:hypothetical protein